MSHPHPAWNNFFYIVLYYLVWCVCMYRHTYLGVHMKVRGQLRSPSLVLWATAGAHTFIPSAQPCLNNKIPSSDFHECYRAGIPTHTHTHACACTCMQAYNVHTHAHMNASAHVCLCAHKCKHTHAHTYAFAHERKHLRMYVRTRTFALTHTHKCSHMHAHIKHVHKQACVCT